jgi:hypothetical protein
MFIVSQEVLMKRHFLQLRGTALGLIILGLFLFAGVNTAISQTTLDKPEAPVLTLVGDENNAYNKTYYPDGRIWLPPKANGEREFLLPVWIDNKWRYYPNTTPKYKPFDITSFSFGIMYDATAIRAVGVQKFGPIDAKEDEEPLAKHFNISWYDVKDMSYKEIFYDDPNPQRPPFAERDKGRLIRVTGTSTSNPLAVTDKGDFKVLLYVRFMVLPEVGSGQLSPKPPTYIKNDTIRYNDWNVAIEPPFMKERRYDPDFVADYPFDQNDRFHGLGGINNLYLGLTEQYVPGSITVSITDNVPEFGFDINRGVGQPIQLQKLNESLYEITDPITVDSNSTNPLYGVRLMSLLNLVSRTRLNDIYIESDQPWLLFKTGTPGAQAGTEKNPIRTLTRKGYINYIDNGILGDERDPLDEPVTKDLPVKLNVTCDPSQLTSGDGAEKAGIYVGYLTFKSDYAIITPVRIKVTFIYFRTPFEGGLQGRNYGITLTLRNSRGSVGDSCKVIFGTGHRATDYVDTLFGEFAYNEPMTNAYFNARFFPMEDEVKAQIPYGFGDWAANDEVTRTLVQNGSVKINGSRDIRDYNEKATSYMYYCKLATPNDMDYPIVIEWDTLDFPSGSSLFLRDAVNGSFFSVNMRNATPLGGSKFSYVISDPRWKDFIIEYTLPREIQFVDQNGKPIIRPGWNLLALPVRPVALWYKNIYPNCINVPFIFTQNQYQSQEYMTPGHGYFMKYPQEIVDTNFKGTFIFRIDPAQTDRIRLYTGWNTIGGCSGPININDVELVRFDNNNIPDINETLAKGFYGYKTDSGYVEVSFIEPGRGYWMYVDKACYLKLIYSAKAAGIEPVSPKSDIYAQSTMLTVRDNAQHNGVLYLNGNVSSDLTRFTLPPRPPQEMFDVRFSNGCNLENADNSMIHLQGATYPVSLGIVNADAAYTFVDAATGEVYGSIARGASGYVVVPKEVSGSVKILKTDAYSGIELVSFPNPVNSVSSVKYVVPENSEVTIKLFDAIGNEIATLLNDYRTAGEYNDVTLSSMNLAAGRYIIKLSTGSQTIVESITVVK